MKRSIHLLVILLSLGCIFNGAAAEQTQEQTQKKDGPLLVADSLTHNFGVIDSRGGDVECTFIVKNCGDEPLVIERVVTSCSCTKASISRKPLAVGESREMKVTYEVRKMPIGLFSKSILIFSTSRDDDMIRFTITGRSSYKSNKK